MTQPERVLFVHAHPDDETISTGGTLATLVERGAVVTLVTCTRGERGEVIPADLQDALGSPERLAALRESELRTAVGILGVTDHRFLGDADARWNGKAPRRYVDSGMQWGPAGTTGPAQPSGEYDPASLTSAEFGDVAADVAAVILAVQPHAVVSYNERGGYGHPDHVRAYAAARRAAEVYGVPFFAVEPEESSAATVSVDVAPVAAKKRGALEAYRSQVIVSGDEFALSNGNSFPIASTERFRRIGAADDAPPEFREQSWAAKASISIIAGLIGAAAGALASVYNQSTIRVFGADLWGGTILGVLLVAVLLVGFRLAFATRVVAFWAAIGVILIVGVFCVQSAGGSILIPLNPIGITWALAPVVVAAVVLVWPQAHRRRPGRIAGQVSDLKGP